MGASSSSGTSRRSRRMVAEINVVPYIDVMLVLLVIFMVTAPLLPPGAIDLPSAGQSNAKTEGFIELIIQRNGSMSVRTRNTREAEQVKDRIGKSELLETVKRLQADQNLPVVISAEKSIAYEKVVEAMDLLRRGGIQRVALMVKAAS
ncbi:MAG: ExbD/TolR family protein [Betaproteobacteria bacterium]|jgi:biopolymer transport protein TolR